MTINNDETKLRAVASSAWSLKAHGGANDGVMYPLSERVETLVGRSNECDVVLDSKGVSRKHARVVIHEGGLLISDLGSVNGTFINEIKITEARAEIEDLVRFDDLTFSVVGPALDPDATVLRPVVVDNDKVKLVGGQHKNDGQSPARKEVNRKKSNVTEKPVMYSHPDTIDAGVPSPNNSEIGKDAEILAEHGSDNTMFQNIGDWEQTDVAESGTLMMKAASGVYSRLMGSNDFSKGMEFRLSLPISSLGRASNNAFIIKDKTISSSHADIIKKDGTWRVIDKGSTNGTYVNDRKITEAEIKIGDKLRFGLVEFVFSNDTSLNVSDYERIQSGNNAGIRAPDNLIRFKKIGLLIIFIILLIFTIVFFMNNNKSASNVVDSAGSTITIEDEWEYILNYSVTATPIIIDLNEDNSLDVISVTVDGQVTGVDGLTGMRLFSLQVDGRGLISLMPKGIDNSVSFIVVTDSGEVTRLDSYGDIKWQLKLPENMGGIYSAAIFRERKSNNKLDVIVSTTEGGTVSISGVHGRMLWNNAFITDGQLYVSPIIHDVNDDGQSNIITVTDKWQVLATVVQSGRIKQLWEMRLPKMFYASPVLLGEKNKFVVIATEKGGVYALDAVSGQKRWHSNLKGSFFSSPVVVRMADGKVYIVVVNMEGDLFSLDSENGSVINEFHLNKRVQATPLVLDANNDDNPDFIILDENGGMNIVDLFNENLLMSVLLSVNDGFIASPRLMAGPGANELSLISISYSGIIRRHRLN